MGRFLPTPYSTGPYGLFQRPAKALMIAKEIAEAISRGEGTAPGGFSPRQIEIWRNVLGTGHAGFSLLHTYLFCCGAGAAHADLAIEHLDQACDFMASVRMSE